MNADAELSSFVKGERRRYIVVRSELRKFSAVIICGPETVPGLVWKMWSCMEFVRPSKRRLIPRRRRPQAELVSAPFFLVEEVG